MEEKERLIYVLVPTYRTIRGVPVVHLYGVSDRGESVLVVDDRVRPYIFVLSNHLEAARDLTGAADAHPDPELLDFLDRPVGRLVFADPRVVPKAREALEAAGILSFEADIRFAYRYMIDKGVRGTAVIRGPAEKGRFTDLVFRRPEFSPGRFVPKLKLLSIDIETDRRAGEVFSVALAGDGIETVLMRAQDEVEGAESVPDERALFRVLSDRIAAADPDVITGWNVVDFDLAVLERRSAELGVPLRIGRGEGTIHLLDDAGFTRQRRAMIPGRQILDGIGLVRDAGLRFTDFRLQTVAGEVLGKSKLASGADRVEQILRAFREDPAWLARYNLEDAKLVIEILEKTGALGLALERSLLTGMPLDRVGATVATFDFLYLRELRKKGRVAPMVPAEPVPGHIVGGTVLESRAGLFSFVAVLDFKSLYPSIIRTFEIDPFAFVGTGDRREGHIRAPNGALFRRDDGILPGIIEELWARRERAKREGDAGVSTAVKLLMNSFYGVLGTDNCRFAEKAVANAITSFGGEILRMAKAIIEGMGFEVLYGDTDSVFVLTRAQDADAAREAGEVIRERVNADLSHWTEEDHGVPSKLELELERVYLRLLLPHVRGGSEGSKKRYAGLVATDGEPKLRIVGLEAVRGDWPEAGRRFQRDLLRRVFLGEDFEDYVRAFVRDLRAGGMDHDLVYRKVLRKNPDEYVRSAPPHVRAARIAGLKRGRAVKYVITRNGPMPTTRDGPLPAGLDYDHYVSRVLEPIANAILPFLDRRFDEVAGDDPQLRLF